MAIIKQASRLTLGQLIGANNPPVTVPNDSQRQYSWTHKEVQQFWKDITKFKTARDTGKESAAEYFIGPIVTITDEKVSSRGLLDGQQRLTTSTILVAALRDAMARTGDNRGMAMANNVQRDWISRRIGLDDPAEYFLTLSNFDKAYFRDHIQNWDETLGRVTPIEHDNMGSHRLIAEAYRFFEKALVEALPSETDAFERLRWLDGLRSTLINGLVFVEVQTPTSSDANEVFETINSRGRDLSTTDLIRNFLMERAATKDEKDRVNAAWETLLVGFDKAEDIERFLRHYWIATHGDVRSHSLYTTIRKELEDDFDERRLSVGGFAADLDGAATRYLDLLGSTTGDDELDTLLEEVRRVGAEAVLPLLLSATRLGLAGVADLLRAYLSYFVRWTLIGKRESTILEETVFGLAKEVAGSMGVEAATQRITDRTPLDRAFFEDFRVARLRKSIHARYVLEKLEIQMRLENEYNEVFPDSRIYTLEHIYPQKPELGLRLPDHGDLVYAIGNLTLLHGRKNIQASNKAFPAKQAKYQESWLLLTTHTNIAELWDSSAGAWSSEGIAARQERLAEIAVRTWPINVQPTTGSGTNVLF